ncbi:hypothetical protein DFH08DRAFT_959791 [Mycena albidolilacea]|uniref:Uncharacterized protein n=1 Tax=Mycena albidolilacea TaxID=1033008 RepID=A0AAD7ET16_9AGAR|nr:hypothetical protein DFH08DRAFT_959791 [Mycena albidolilacea]
MSSRRHSLHPSALSDAEHALFTASLADLADVDVYGGTTDWERISVSVREARAWVCGRYPGLGAGRVDEMLHLFPAPTFGGGAFFALLRLVLHTQAGTPVDRSLAFVQAPIPVPVPTPAPVQTQRNSNPFLPTPEARPIRAFPGPPTPRSTASESSATSSSTSSSAVSAPRGERATDTDTPSPRRYIRRRAPPFRARRLRRTPLRRASTQTHGNPTNTIRAPPNPPTKLSNRNPFRAPPLPPRHASASAEAPPPSFTKSSSASPNSAFTSLSNSHFSSNANNGLQ